MKKINWKAELLLAIMLSAMATVFVVAGMFLKKGGAEQALSSGSFYLFCLGLFVLIFIARMLFVITGKGLLAYMLSLLFIAVTITAVISIPSKLYLSHPEIVLLIFSGIMLLGILLGLFRRR
jgi:glucose dehydrogenase